MWHAIAGSRDIQAHVAMDVMKKAKEIILNGEGIVTGGALGVDFVAAQMVLEYGDCSQLRIFLPVELEVYLEHYGKMADEGEISKAQADALSRQLRTIHEKCPDAIRDKNEFEKVDDESYRARKRKIMNDADELYAFHVNNSPGTGFTIELAQEKGIPVNVRKY